MKIAIANYCNWYLVARLVVCIQNVIQPFNSKILCTTKFEKVKFLDVYTPSVKVACNV